MNQQLEQTYDTTWEQDIASAKGEMVKSAFHAVAAGIKFRDAKEKHRAIYGGTGWEQACKERELTTRTVDALIQVANAFGENSEINFSIFSATVLKMIAAPSVPEPVREKIIDQAHEQGHMTVAEARKLMNQEYNRGRQQQSDEDKAIIEEQETRRIRDIQAARNQRIESLQQRIEKKDAEIQRLRTLTPTKPNQQEIADAEQKLQSLQVELSLMEHRYKSQTRTHLKTAAEIALRDYLKVLCEDDTQELDELASLVDAVKTDIMRKRQPSENHQIKPIDLDLSHI